MGEIWRFNSPTSIFFMELKDLKPDKRNYRKHTKRNLDLIKKSVAEVLNIQQ